MATESLQHFIDTLKARLAKVLAENARLQERVEEAESHGCQDCAYEVGVPVPGPTGLCPKHADEQIDGRHEERRRRVRAEALAERRKRAGQILLVFIRLYAGNVDPGEVVRKYGYAARAAIEEKP